MIVPAMTPDEIYKEIIEDSISVFKSVNTKSHIQMLVMIRTHQLSWVETIHIKSPRKNDWSAVVNFRPGKKEFNLYVTANEEQGIVAYNFILINEVPLLIKYNAHFFKRCRERMHLDETKPGQVVKKYFRNNITFTPTYTDTEYNYKLASIALPEGMGLGRMEKGSPITEMKTFIAQETLTKNQRELVQLLNEDETFHKGISFIGTIHEKKKKDSEN